MTSIESNTKGEQSISIERKNLLIEISETIKSRVRENGHVNVMFICTHNSRRSQLAQVLATYYAHEFQLKNLDFFSGGTESTSFNYRMVNALISKKFNLIQKTHSVNPVYRLKKEEDQLPGLYFSKAYTHELNPQQDFIAIMVCDHADENCPLVFGASDRFSLHYKDPKDFDGTEQEGNAYLNKVEEIGNEIHFMLNQL